MKLVVEELESISVLSEDVGEGKEPEYYLEGIFLQANKKKSQRANLSDEDNEARC